MMLLISIILVSIVIGRVNLIENIVFKSFGDGRHYDPVNMSLFFLIGLIKIVLALFIASKILPNAVVLEASKSIEKDQDMWQLSYLVYQYTFRTVLVSFCVIICHAIGIWKVKN